MAADVKVNEALSGLIESGQSALIKTDAIPDVVISGTVLGVSVLAEDGGWRDPNRRDYGVEVELDENHGLALKPSMRVKVDIFVDKVVDALFVPIQAIHRRGRNVFVYLRDGDEYIEQIVDIKRNSELFVEVVEGLVAGNQVLLIDPPAGTVIRPIDGATEK
jgi:multidrug efflux pump subunit AcrA (membrane-fusion protein)